MWLVFRSMYGLSRTGEYERWVRMVMLAGRGVDVYFSESGALSAV